MPVASGLMTVEEFAKLPTPGGGVRQELHHGELVQMPPVKKPHTRIQGILGRLLRKAIDDEEFEVLGEFPFRPAAEYEVWVADIAVVSAIEFDSDPDGPWYRGVPAIVIEVLSPSNTVAEMDDREAVCLKNGGREFWTVHPEREFVSVTNAAGVTKRYHPGELISLGALGAGIAVADIFAKSIARQPRK